MADNRRSVRISKHYKMYVPGDQGKFAPDEAAKIVEGGFGMYLDGPESPIGKGRDELAGDDVDPDAPKQEEQDGKEKQGANYQGKEPVGKTGTTENPSHQEPKRRRTRYHDRMLRASDGPK